MRLRSKLVFCGGLGLLFAACSSDERSYDANEGSGASGSSGANGDFEPGGDAGTGGKGRGDEGQAGEGGEPSEEPSEVLVEDDFSDNTASWKFVDAADPKWSDVPKSEWAYVDGWLVQSSNYAGCSPGPDPSCPSLREEPTIALFNRAGADEWTDYSVTATFVSFDDDNVGVIARYLDEDNYLLFEMNGTVGEQVAPGYARFRSVQGGVWSELVMDEAPVKTYTQSTSGSEHPATLKLTVVGNEYTAYLDGIRLLKYTDNSSEVPARGRPGLTSLSSVGVRFDSVKVSEE